MSTEEVAVETVEATAPESAPVEAVSTPEVASAEPAKAAPEVAAPTSAEPEAPKFSYPSTDKFDFSEWDGSVDDFPEDAREFLGAAHKHYSGQAESHAQELADLRQLWRANSEDPRIGELTDSAKSWEEKFNESTKQLEAYKAQVQKAIDADAKAYEENFKRRHPEVYTDKTKGAALLKFIKDGWDAEAAVKLIDGSEEMIKAAQVFKTRGAPDELAVELASKQFTANEAKPSPRPAAAKVSGAQGNRVSGSVEGLGKTRSIADLRSLALNRAQRRFNLPE